MTPGTLKALKGSILKWEKIVLGTGEDHGHKNCPLCQKFNKKADCHGCPVMDFTGFAHCEDTPYEAWEDATGLSAKPQNAEQRQLAYDMLEFLRGLLPLPKAKTRR